MPVQHYSELRVYRSAFELQQELFDISRGFPREEQYSLTSQVRRSSRSVGASIAEGRQKRRYEAAFVHKLSDADSEVAETQHWLRTALACEYFDRDTFDRLDAATREIGAMLGSMMRDSESWCKGRRDGGQGTVDG
jgi:four helix bundle protein